MAGKIILEIPSESGLSSEAIAWLEECAKRMEQSMNVDLLVEQSAQRYVDTLIWGSSVWLEY